MVIVVVGRGRSAHDAGREMRDSSPFFERRRSPEEHDEADEDDEVDANGTDENNPFPARGLGVEVHIEGNAGHVTVALRNWSQCVP